MSVEKVYLVWREIGNSLGRRDKLLMIFLTYGEAERWLVENKSKIDSSCSIWIQEWNIDKQE